MPEAYRKTTTNESLQKLNKIITHHEAEETVNKNLGNNIHGRSTECHVQIKSIERKKLAHGVL